MNGVYAAQDLVADNIKDKDSKKAFLQKSIDALGLLSFIVVFQSCFTSLLLLLST